MKMSYYYKILNDSIHILYNCKFYTITNHYANAMFKIYRMHIKEDISLNAYTYSINKLASVITERGITKSKYLRSFGFHESRRYNREESKNAKFIEKETAKLIKEKIIAGETPPQVEIRLRELGSPLKFSRYTKMLYNNIGRRI